MLLKVIEANEDSQEEHCFQWYAPTPAALAGGELSEWLGRSYRLQLHFDYHYHGGDLSKDDDTFISC